jgi:hypothetical protein
MSAVLQRRGARAAWVVWLTVGFVLLYVPVADAYIDPGSGSIIFQAVIAGAMAASVGIKVFWKRIKSFFASVFGTRSEGAAADRPDQDETVGRTEAADQTDEAERSR